MNVNVERVKEILACIIALMIAEMINKNLFDNSFLQE